MRSEQQILDLIIDTARNDDRVRVVIMNGSRANSNAVRDIFQDFDIIYLVTDVEPFKNDLAWINRFGEIMILQTPEAMEDPPPLNNGTFNYLMQFVDGNRIDLTLYPIDKLPELENDSLSLLLLEKDRLLKPFPPPGDIDYLPKPPTVKAFSDCCNEFWWVSLTVAKALWREEIIAAKTIQEQYLRAQLMKMLTWYVGMKTQFTRSPGKMGKHFKRHLEPSLWALLEKTYADASYENSWDALFVMCDLFRLSAREVAEHFGFDYPLGDDERASAHLRHVRTLPRNAAEMY